MSDTTSRHGWQYVIQPFETILLNRLDEIRTLVGLSSFAIANLQGIARLTKVLRHPDEKVSEARRVEDLAKSEIENEFPVLHGAGIILVWGGLEAAVRDFIVRWIARCQGALQSESVAKLRVLIGEYELLRGEDRARYLLRLLERDGGATLRPGVARFEFLLHPLGIAPAISESDRRELIELAALRNVLVHRAGVVDTRLTEACPWLPVRQGDRVRINSGTFQRYATAAGEYAAAIIEAGEKVFREEGS